MSFANRREFLRASSAFALSAAVPADLFAQSVATPLPSGAAWDPGSVRHLLPTVSDSRILIKASFNAPLPAAPTLRIGETSVPGRMSDTRGEFWHFYATDLRPGHTYQLSIVRDHGRPVCEPWELATFPAPDERPGQFRVLFFSCAGGHEAMKFLPPAVRNRLLRRALSFQPQAAVANGDHVYWDLLSPLTSKRYGASAEAEKIAEHHPEADRRAVGPMRGSRVQPSRSDTGQAGLLIQHGERRWPGDHHLRGRITQGSDARLAIAGRGRRSRRAAPRGQTRTGRRPSRRTGMPAAQATPG